MHMTIHSLVHSSFQEDDVVGENQDEGDGGNESDMDLDLLAESESDSEASNHSNQVYRFGRPL